MRSGIFHKSFRLFLAAAVCAVGMWTYAERVLIPYQKADADAHERPRGNLSDLYPRWLGARELLLHGRDPYSADVTREIQAGYYGRALDPSRPNDPHDEQGFAYPVYVVFFLAPTIRLPFPIVQKAFLWILIVLTAVSVPLWLRVLRWSAPPSTHISLLALVLGSLGVMQGLKLQQMSLLVGGLMAIAIALLVTGSRARRWISAGFGEHETAIRIPVAALACRLDRGGLASPLSLGDFIFGRDGVLMAASEWYLPHWLPRFWHAVREYQRYTGAFSVMDSLIGAPWSWAVEFFAFAATMGVCWRERRQSANTGSFGFTLSLVLATTILLVPTCSPNYQILLIPACLVLAKERRMIWQSNVANRILLVITAGLILWPWISSIALAGLSFVLPRETVERGWAIPFWTVTEIPVAVAGLMLVYYYQRTFAASARPGTS